MKTKTLSPQDNIKQIRQAVKRIKELKSMLRRGSSDWVAAHRTEQMLRGGLKVYIDAIEWEKRKRP